MILARYFGYSGPRPRVTLLFQYSWTRLRLPIKIAPLIAAFFIFVAASIHATTSYANTSHADDDIDPELRALLKKSIAEADSFQDRFDAEVWLMTKSEPLSRFVKDPEQRLHMLKLIHREATRANVPPNLVLAVIHIESHFNRFALSHVGAQGIMQVMPFWKKEIGRENDNLIDLETNLRYGCTILRHYLNREKDHWANALARYNGSYGSYRYSQKVMDVWSRYWR